MIRGDLCHAWSSFQIIGARGFISSIYRQAFLLHQIQRKCHSHKRKEEEERVIEGVHADLGRGTKESYIASHLRQGVDEGQS